MTLPSISEEDDDDEEEDEENEDNERTLLSPITSGPVVLTPGVNTRTNRMNFLYGIGRSHTVAAIGNNSGANTPINGSDDKLQEKLHDKLSSLPDKFPVRIGDRFPDRLQDRFPDRQDRLQDRLQFGTDQRWVFVFYYGSPSLQMMYTIDIIMYVHIVLYCAVFYIIISSC